MKENLFNNICYMNEYKVFCFSDVYITNKSNDSNVTKYFIGDLIPTSNYNYIYSPNLLVVDYINKVIHIIINSRYYEMIQMGNGELKISTDSLLYKMLFGKFKYKVIDIYGNFLKIKNIEDLVIAITTYPQIELYLTNNKYLKCIDNDESFSNVIIENINYTDSESICYINGYYKANEENENTMLIVSSNIKNSLQNPSKSLYLKNWVDTQDILNIVTEFLLNVRLLYLINKNNILKPFTYYNKDSKSATHIGKVQRYLEDFIVKNDCELIESILEIIFLYAEYEEDFEDFIISIVSEYAEVKIV